MEYRVPRGAGPSGVGAKGYCLGELTIVIEKHSDGYVAYPIGIDGVVVGEGDSFDEVLADVVSAIKCHIETFGIEHTA